MVYPRQSLTKRPVEVFNGLFYYSFVKAGLVIDPPF